MSRPPAHRFLLLSTVLLAAASAKLGATPAPRPWPAHPFAPVTPERIAQLPAAEQPAWRAYLATSTARAQLSPKPAHPKPDFSPEKPLPGLPTGGIYTKGLRLDQPAAWYASAEAQAIADRVAAAQTPAGAWTKGNNYTTASAGASSDHGDLWSAGTFDNDATVRELQFLARVATASAESPHAEAWRTAFLRGLDYCFAAQYPNGGFPQIYPIGGGYHDAITYNDDAMANVLEVLRDVANARSDYRFVPPAVRSEAAKRFARGIGCILATQLKDANGALTIWCQQYDALTLAPCAARNFEPTAACANESSRLLELLMSLPEPSPATIAAVDAGVTWLQHAALHNVAWDRSKRENTGLVEHPGAAPLWARFYDLETGAPIFGDRDRTIHYAVTEISTERRLGYNWYGTWPARALKLHTTWRTRVAAR